jgi:uncharacterized protein (TIGR02246 family)
MGILTFPISPQRLANLTGGCHATTGVHAMGSNDEEAVREIYQALLRHWNGSDATKFAALFLPDGIVVGFDGTEYCSAQEIAEGLAAIFRDHKVATYVSKIRGITRLDDHTIILRAVAGMTPPGSRSIKPERKCHSPAVGTKAG